MWTVIALGFLAAQWGLSYVKKRWFTDPLPLPALSAPRAGEGTAVPLVYGRRLVRSPLVIWTGNPYTLNVEDQFNVFFIPIQFAICLSNQNPSTLTGPLPRLCPRGVWFNEDRAFSYPPNPPIFEPPGVRARHIVSANTPRWTDESRGIAEFSNGSWDVTAGTHATALNGDAIPYRGVATCLLSHVNKVSSSLTTTGFQFGGGGSLPAVAFEVQNGVSIPGVDQDLMELANGDANPAGVLYDLLTNPFGGRLGIDPSLIDVDSFEAAAVILAEEENGFSAVYYNPVEIQSIIEDVLKQTDGNLLQHPETLLWTYTLVREIEDVGALPLYSDEDILDISLFEQSTWVNVPNMMYLNYEARSIQSISVLGQTIERVIYRDATAMAPNSARQADTGVTLPETVTMPGISNPDLADVVAARFLRSMALPLLRGTVTVSRKGIFLAPGDAIRIQHRKLQNRIFVMRVARQDIGEFRSNGVVLNLVQDKFSFTQSLTTTPPVIGEIYPAELSDNSVVQETPRFILGLAEGFGAQPRDTQRLLYLAQNPNANTGFRGLLVRGEDPTANEAIDAPGCRYSNTFVLDVAYSHANDPYDTTVGIAINPVESWTPETSVADEDIRVRGYGLILIDEEFLTYESATDQGGGIWLLENVRRGQLDTVPADHAEGALGYMVDLSAPVADGTSIFPNVGRNGLSYQEIVQTFIADMRGPSIFTKTSLAAEELEVGNRTIRPYPPADVKMGTKSVLDGESAVLALAQTAAKAPNWMYEEGIDVTWKRRDRFNPFLLIGSDADETPTEDTEYQLVATKDGVTTVAATASTSPFTQQSLSSIGYGSQKIGLRALHQDVTTGAPYDWISWQTREFDVELYSWRNLLIYPRMAVSTGWSAFAGTLAVSSTGGPTYQCGYFTGSADPTSIRQRMTVTGYNPYRMRASMTFYTKRQGGDMDDTIAASLLTTDASNVTQDTASYAAAVGEATWTRHDIAIANCDADTAKISAEFTLDAVGELDVTPQASVSEVRVRLGQHTANQVSNGSFESGLTGWTSAAGGFTVETGAPLEGAQYIQGSANASNERYQDVAVPAGFANSRGVCTFGVRHPGPSINSSAQVILESRDSGGTVLYTETADIPLSSLLDSVWFRCVAHVHVPYNAANVRIRLVATRLSGTNNQVQFDDVDLEFHKYLDPQEEVEWNFTPASQPMPRNVGQWNKQYPTIAAPNVCWLDGTLEPVLGYEPEFETSGDAFADCKFTGLVNNGETVSHPAFETRRGTNSCIRTVSNRRFGNFRSDQAFTVRVVFDCREEPTSIADFGLAGRMGTTGWSLMYDSGQIRATLTGATTSVTQVADIAHVTRTWAAFSYDPGSEQIRVMTPLETTVASTTGIGEISCEELVRLIIGATAQGGAAMNGLIATFQIWNEAVPYADLVSLWDTTFGAFEGWSITNGGLASAARVITVMGADNQGVTAGYTTAGMVYNRVPNANTWGIACGSRNNLIPATNTDPNRGTGWTNSGLTLDDNYENGPVGERNGIKLTGTNAQYYRVAATVTATGTINVTFFARADVAHDARLSFANSSGSVLDTVVIELDTVWKRFTCSIVTWDGSTAAVHLRFSPSDTGSSADMIFAGPVYVDQNAVDHIPPFICLDSADVYYDLEALSGNLPFDGTWCQEGEIEVDVIMPNPSPGSAPFVDLISPTGNEDRRTLNIETGSTLTFDHYDGAGTAVTSEASGLDWTSLQTIRARWNRAGLLDAANAFAGVKVGITTDYDRTAIWTPGTVGAEYLQLGGAGDFEGTITRLVCRTREQILPRSEF